jgi:hypothetical protein
MACVVTYFFEAHFELGQLARLNQASLVVKSLRDKGMVVVRVYLPDDGHDRFVALHEYSWGTVSIGSRVSTETCRRKQGARPLTALTMARD